MVFEYIGMMFRSINFLGMGYSVFFIVLALGMSIALNKNTLKEGNYEPFGAMGLMFLLFGGVVFIIFDIMNTYYLIFTVIWAILLIVYHMTKDSGGK